MNKLQDNTFAAACYNHNTLDELRAIMGKQPDPEDMRIWGITSAEWTEQIEIAIAALEEKAAA